VESETVEGPRQDDLEFLDSALDRSDEANRVVLMHMPPRLDGHYAPHENWGFGVHESEFLRRLHRHRVKLVCCARGLAFDDHMHEGIRFVMSARKVSKGQRTAARSSTSLTWRLPPTVRSREASSKLSQIQALGGTDSATENRRDGGHEVAFRENVRWVTPLGVDTASME
jgi:hypothetical protein